MHRDTLPTVSLTSSVDYFHFVETAFMRSTWAEGLHVVRGSAWITAETLERLPWPVEASAQYHHAARQDVLVRCDDGIAHLILQDRALTARVAGLSRAPDAAVGVDARHRPSIGTEPPEINRCQTSRRHRDQGRATKGSRR